MAAFEPFGSNIGGTIGITAVSTSSGSPIVPLFSGPSILVVNNASVTLFVRIDSTGTTGATAVDIPILSGTMQVLANPAPFSTAYCSVAASVYGGGTVYFSADASTSQTGGVPAWALPNSALDLNFSTGQYYGGTLSSLTVTRAQASSFTTNLLASSASGFAYSTFAANIPRTTSGLGLLVEEQRTNVLLNSTAPATQTTASLGTGTYTLWVNGSGSATSSAGTATITGAGAATQGSPNVFVVTVAGTVTITKAGSLNAFQCERNPGTVSVPTSLIITGGTTVTRPADTITCTAPSFGGAYSLYSSAIPYAPTSFASDQVFICVDDGTSNNRLMLQRTGATGAAAITNVSGGSSNTTSSGQTWAASTLGKLIGTDTTGAQAVDFNATAVVTAANIFPVGVTNLRIGSNTAGSPTGSTHISRIGVWPTTALSSAVMRSVTTGNGP